MSTHIKIELPRNSRSPDAIALLKSTCLRSSSAGGYPQLPSSPRFGGFCCSSRQIHRMFARGR